MTALTAREQRPDLDPGPDVGALIAGVVLIETMHRRHAQEVAPASAA